MLLPHAFRQLCFAVTCFLRHSFSHPITWILGCLGVAMNASAIRVRHGFLTSAVRTNVDILLVHPVHSFFVIIPRCPRGSSSSSAVNVSMEDYLSMDVMTSEYSRRTISANRHSGKGVTRWWRWCNWSRALQLKLQFNAKANTVIEH